MDRLICSDIGFGKTEVAVRAAFKAVVNGKRVTIWCHHHSGAATENILRAAGSDFGVSDRVDYINRFRSSAEKRILGEAGGRQVDIIGTPCPAGQDVKFKDLGLLIVDEGQKFGVSARRRNCRPSRSAWIP